MSNANIPKGFKRIFVRVKAYNPNFYKRPYIAICSFDDDRMNPDFQKFAGKPGAAGSFDFYAPIHSILMMGQSASDPETQKKPTVFFIVDEEGKLNKLSGGYSEAKNLFGMYNRISEESFETSTYSLIDLDDQALSRLNREIATEIKRRKSARA